MAMEGSLDSLLVREHWQCLCPSCSAAEISNIIIDDGRGDTIRGDVVAGGLPARDTESELVLAPAAKDTAASLPEMRPPMSKLFCEQMDAFLQASVLLAQLFHGARRRQGARERARGGPCLVVPWTYSWTWASRPPRVVKRWLPPVATCRCAPRASPALPPLRLLRADAICVSCPARRAV